MYIKKYLTVLSIFIYIFANSAWAETKPISLFLSGHKVGQGIKVIEKNKIRYINLPFLTNYFHIVADWDPVEGEIFLKFGNLGIKMYENSTRYTVNGGKRSLVSGPFERDGELWFPVEFILRLGLVIKGQDRANLSFNWAHNYLLAVEKIQYHGRPAFLLIGVKELKPKPFTLTNPDRLVIGLPGFKAHFTLEDKVNAGSGVEKIRFKQLDGDNLQLVFDLKQATGYRIIQEPDQPNQAIVAFNYLIEEVNFLNDLEEKVDIKTSLPAEYKVETTNELNRMIIEFRDATLAALTDLNPVESKWIGSIQLNQIDPYTVRVTINLLLPEPGYVIRSPINPNLIQVRRFQDINRIQWLDTGPGGKLIIESSGELVESIRKLRNPERLMIELDFAQFSPDITVPEGENDYINEIKIAAIDATSVRIEAGLKKYVGYTVEISPDRHSLSIYFMKSPLVDKTIVIDAGHGGVDLGACGRQGTYEKNINLDVVLRLKDLMEEAGAAVVLTRSDDSYIGLYERAFIANYLFADLFISVHANNHPNLSVHGIEIFYYKERDFGKQLAQSVLTKMGQFTGSNLLGVKVQEFVVIRETQMPGILIELGFLSNFQEEAALKTVEFKEKAAMGIFQGIMDHYQAVL